MVIGELIQQGRILNTEQPYKEARLILSYVSGLDLTYVTVHSEKALPSDICEQYITLLNKRKDGMPLAYITGKKEFYGHCFKVSPDVLIPRADTEILTEFAINSVPGSLIDICTGSGCIAISVKKALPHCRVSALDISESALKIAEENAAFLGADVQFFKTDILNEIPNEKYDFIVSNPPYIKSGDIKTLDSDVRMYEPLSALDGGSRGLIFYERIVNIAPHILNRGGILAFEIGFDQADDVYKIMKPYFNGIDFITDLSGIKRVIFGSRAAVYDN